MNGQIFEITLEQMKFMVEADGNTLSAAKLSRPLLAGYYAGELMCVMGLVPSSLLSDRAYLWMISTDAVGDHKVVFGRAAKKFIAIALMTYGVIVGHCTNAKSKAWLTRLGAEFNQQSFEIRRA